MRGHNIYSLQGSGRDLARCSPLSDLFRCFRRKLTMLTTKVLKGNRRWHLRGDEATAVLAQLSTTKVIYYYDETNNNNNTITTGVNIMMDKDTLLLLIQRVVV